MYLLTKGNIKKPNADDGKAGKLNNRYKLSNSPGGEK